MDAKAVVVLPNWHVYKSIIKKLKLHKPIPIGEEEFTRPTTTCNYDPPKKQTKKEISY